MHEVEQAAVLLGAGVLAGLVGSAGGITSLVSYPALLVVGLPALAANVANSVALVACWPGSALASRPELQGRGRWLARWAPLAAAGGVAGSVLLLSTPPGVFARVVPFLVAAGSLALLASPRLAARRQQARGEPAAARLALPAGLAALSAYNGFFGAGSGVMTLALVLVTVDDEPAAGQRPEEHADRRGDGRVGDRPGRVRAGRLGRRRPARGRHVRRRHARAARRPPPARGRPAVGGRWSRPGPGRRAPDPAGHVTGVVCSRNPGPGGYAAYHRVMTDTRRCDQCGTVFAPRREHARFCSGRCRVAWKRVPPGDPVTEVSALAWSAQAMAGMTRELPSVPAGDRPRALAAIGEVVWQVTIVDATLVRYYPEAYDGVLAGLPRADRRGIEGTLSGLRFVRNRLRHHAADLVAWPEGAHPGGGPAAAWVWQPVPEPSLESLPPGGRLWETTRYRDYQDFLARRPVGETLGPVTDFLALAAAPAVTEVSEPAAR